ncbi:TRAP transporter substrate-binding protein DctP [Cytobacillus depressus]|uniref:TRAP transporter substrate-binding protein n=1 Tax=Cytobacillus depressus TaxID=1602942 RepID=UPI001478553C|nr:TRAP transporter substrate-binding protein DctP [Cytobacillus depressus]
MKRTARKIFVVLLLFMLTVGLVACNAEKTQGNNNTKNTNGANNDAQVIIKIADNLPKTHLISTLGTLPWIDRIEELGKGKIKVEYYPAEQLGKASSLLDIVKNKVADIALIGPQWIGDVMPLSSVSGNPGLVKDAVSGSRAFNKLVQEDLYELEFKPNKIKPLWAATTNPYQIVNSKHPVEAIKDFKGLKIRTADGLQEKIMHSWGVTAVTIPGPEMYTAWDRGTVDGTLLSLFSWPAYQLDSIAKYATVNASLSAFGLTFSVNEQVWNSWPKDVQDAVWLASQEIVDKFGNGVVEHENELMKEYVETSHVEFYTLPEDELQEWNNELQPFNKKWAEDLDAKGSPGTKILEKFKQYNEEFSN